MPESETELRRAEWLRGAAVNGHPEAQPCPVCIANLTVKLGHVAIASWCEQVGHHDCSKDRRGDPQ